MTFENKILENTVLQSYNPTNCFSFQTYIIHIYL
nr:MAG TPA: hypothetical protein [Caudoviricetes sp.]